MHESEKCEVKVKSLSRVRPLATPGTAAPSVHGIFQARVMEWGAISLLVSVNSWYLANWRGEGIVLFICCQAGAFHWERPVKISHLSKIWRKGLCQFLIASPKQWYVIQVVATGSNCSSIQALAFFHTPNTMPQKIGATTSEFHFQEVPPLSHWGLISVYGTWWINS